MGKLNYKVYDKIYSEIHRGILSTYFISDLHLDENSQNSLNLFSHLVDKYIINANSLYILGDFFEYWIGDDAITPFQKKILDILKKLKDHSVSVYFMHGNRDFLISKNFIKLTNCKVLVDPSIIKLNNKNILLSHGDIFCTLDYKHQAYRKFIRNKMVQFLLMQCPLHLRYKLANYLRNLNKNKELSINIKYDVVQSIINKTMLQHNAEILIHGHTHAPSIHQFNFEHKLLKRIVLGSWDSKAYILHHSMNNNFKLIKITSNKVQNIVSYNI